jgi:hypothetical protein
VSKASFKDFERATFIGIITLKNGMTDPKITAYVIALGEGLTSASTLRDPLSAC